MLPDVATKFKTPSDETTYPARARRRRRFWFALAALAVGVAAVATGAWFAWPSGGDPTVPAFRHALVVVFNKEQDEVAGNPAAPTFAALARQYATLSAYEAVTHPSLPTTSRSSQARRTESSPTAPLVSCAPPTSPTNCSGPDRPGGHTRKGCPVPGFTGATAGLYAKKHNPFLYFASIAQNRSRRARVVPLKQLHRDLAAKRLPDFALVIPNLCHDMHDCPVATGDRWLRRTIVPLLRDPQLAGSVVFVVFDEGATDKGGGGHVAALALGPLVQS